MGQRVAAVFKATMGEVFLFGFGEVVAKEIPPPGVVGPDGLALARKKEEDYKIQLDDGEVVWNVEAHLINEEDFLTVLKNRKVLRVSVGKLRAMVKENPAAVTEWEAHLKLQRAKLN